jgi:cytochrome c biogenesis protein CcdA
VPPYLVDLAGTSTVFVPFGASASAIGALVQAWSAQLSLLAGVAIILMGLHQATSRADEAIEADIMALQPLVGGE